MIATLAERRAAVARDLEDVENKRRTAAAVMAEEQNGWRESRRKLQVNPYPSSLSVRIVTALPGECLAAREGSLPATRATG